MEEPKNVDKRSKVYREWKEWKKNFDEKQAKKPEGLGDVVAKVTKATGIDKLVKFVAGEDCGCDERQQILNKWLPFNKPKCLTEDEYVWLNDFFSKSRTSMTMFKIKEMYAIYNRVFSTELEATTCSSCIRNVTKKLQTIYKAYE